MGDSKKNEENLANEIKNICIKKFGETKFMEVTSHIERTAQLLNKMGLLYKTKSPDKIALIQCAVLLNAAISRCPINKKFKIDLKELCSHVLEISKAQKPNTNLIKFSNDVAGKVTDMRNATKDSLEQFKKIPYDSPLAEIHELELAKINDIKLLQSNITDKYKNIMKFISEKCEEIMGNSPCKYAVVGMGSLARKEVTPYSDFEHVIVLEDSIEKLPKAEYENALNYFRWFTVIFQLIVINLHETIIPSVAIPSLNDFTKDGGDWFFDRCTKRGISFDGLMAHACKLPLGRTTQTENKPWTTELIQPVSKMARFLEADVNLKNGYNLANVLTQTCFVSGDEDLHTAFLQNVADIMKRNKELNHPLIMKQLAEDLQNFDAFDNLNDLKKAKKCNIKQVVYRSTTLFISALGQLLSCYECSSFDIVSSLRKQELINQETAHKLSYAVAVACEVRLQIYMSKCCQDDYIEVKSFKLSHPYIDLLKTVGKKSLTDYFVIAYRLQKALRNKDLTNLDSALKPDPWNLLMVLNLLKLYNRVIEKWEWYQSHDFETMPSKNKDIIKYYVAHAYLKLYKAENAKSILESLSTNRSPHQDYVNSMIEKCNKKPKRSLNVINEIRRNVD